MIGTGDNKSYDDEMGYLLDIASHPDIEPRKNLSQGVKEGDFSQANKFDQAFGEFSTNYNMQNREELSPPSSNVMDLRGKETPNKEDNILGERLGELMVGADIAPSSMSKDLGANDIGVVDRIVNLLSDKKDDNKSFIQKAGGTSKQINPTMKSMRDALTNHIMNMSEEMVKTLHDTLLHPENIVGTGELGATIPKGNIFKRNPNTNWQKDLESAVSANQRMADERWANKEPKLVEEYKAGTSIAELAKKYDIPYNTIRYRLDKLGEGKPRRKYDTGPDWFREEMKQ